MRQNYDKMTYEELGRKLNRTSRAVQTRVYIMGLKKEKTTVWTQQKIKILTDFFSLMFNRDLALWIGVSEKTLKRKAKEIGLKKGEVFYKRKKAVMLQRQSEGLKKIECATRFRKGHRASPETEFKKGYKPSAEIIAKRQETRKRNRGNERIRSKADQV